MNVQDSLIRKLMVYEFELSRNTAEATEKTFVVRKVKAQLMTEAKQMVEEISSEIR